jgi:gas vesicle structural protein
VSVATRGTSSNYLQRAPSPSGLADVLDLILDKGLVIDAYVRVSVIGIELLTIDARIVVASVDTYLRFAEAVNRLDLTQTELAGLPELQQRVPEEMAKHAVEKAEEKPKRALKKAEQEPEHLAKRGEKKAKGIFDELKDRARGKTH